MITREEIQRAKEGIADRLRELRIHQGLTQDELAKSAHTSQAVIQKIENGKSKNPRIVGNLALALGVNPAWLQWGQPYAPMRIEQPKPIEPASTPKHE